MDGRYFRAAHQPQPGQPPNTQPKPRPPQPQWPGHEAQWEEEYAMGGPSLDEKNTSNGITPGGGEEDGDGLSNFVSIHGDPGLPPGAQCEGAVNSKQYKKQHPKLCHEIESNPWEPVDAFCEAVGGIPWSPTSPECWGWLTGRNIGHAIHGH